MKKKLLSLALCLVMVLSFIPTTAFAAEYERPFVVTGGSDYYYDIGRLYINGSGSYTISMREGVTSTAVAVIINSTGDVTLTLKDVNIDQSYATMSAPALQISENTGNVTINLEGANRLISDDGYAALQKDSGKDSKLTIKGSGSLYAEAKLGGAGIGGGIGKDGCNITISGGSVQALSLGKSAGIGGGEGGDGYDITISGGSVSATSRLNCYSTGIGGGANGKGYNITISGDTTNVYVRGAIGIGSGVATSFPGGGSTSNITIAGGTVDVNAAFLGIGALGVAKDITISGGNVTTRSTRSIIVFLDGGAEVVVNTPIAIGGGDAENITISGGTVDANGCIGGAWSAKNIRITGGTVTARGNTDYMFTLGGLGDPEKISLPGIGGGRNVLGLNAGGCDTIEISGGTVTAYGAGNSAGIGSAEGSDARNITISGGTVTAVSGYNGPAIGAGKDGANINNIIKPQIGQRIHAWSSESETTPDTAIFARKLQETNTGTDVTELGNHRTVKLVLDSDYIFLVNFDTNGVGTAPQSRYLYRYDPRGLPTGLMADGTLITGWYRDSACTQPFGVDNFTSDITLYTNAEKMDLLFTDENGNALMPGTGGYTYTSGIHTFQNAGEVSVRMADGAASTDQRIWITGNTNLTLNSVYIEVPGDRVPIIAGPPESGIRLTLKGSSTLKSTNSAAIGTAFSFGPFIINGDGSLLAVSEEDYSAIGGVNILLQGGTITAYGGEGYPAIDANETNKLAPSAGQAFTVTEVTGMSGDTPILGEKAFLENITSETATTANVLNKRGLQIRFHDTVATHTHDWATTWSKDETYHWHECEGVGDCDITDNSLKDSYGEHQYTNYVYQNDATYTSDGTEKAECDFGCGATNTRTAAGTKLKDSIAPNGDIKIGTDSIKKLFNTITFGLFFKDTQTIEITADDNESGVKSVQYYLSTTILSEDEVKAITSWTDYNEAFSVNPNNRYVVYVKITDNQNNETYLGSDGLVLDDVAPQFSGIENGKTYCESVSFTVSDDSLDTVMANGNDLTAVNGGYTLTEGTYTVVATDKAGNQASVSITVNASHTYGSWTSNGDGTHTRHCTVAGCDGHEDGNCSGAPATETTPQTCTECGYEIAPALTHDYAFDSFVWDGFTAKAKYVCSHDASHVVLYDATISSEITLQPNCTEAGTRTYTATYDGNSDTKTEPLAATGHAFGAWQDEVPATCIATGTKGHKDCTICGKHFDANDAEITDLLLPIDSDNHDIEHHNAQAPTCTAVGWDSYDACSRCDYSTYVEKSATGHNYNSEWKFDAMGHWKECDCGDKQTATAHTPDRTAPTETEPVKCSVCGYVITPATGHIHNGVFVPEVSATAEDTGTKAHYKCEGCGKLFSDETCTQEITTADLVMPKLAPALLSGDNGKFIKGSSTWLSFKSSAALDDLISVSVDGTVIAKANYTEASGSTIITLKPEYLNTLAVGEHTLTITSNTGSVDAKFTVEAKATTAPDDDDPATPGDDTPGTPSDDTHGTPSDDNSGTSTDSTSPQTGDDSNIFLWVALMFVAGIGVVITTVLAKKKRYNR